MLGRRIIFPVVYFFVLFPTARLYRIRVYSFRGLIMSKSIRSFFQVAGTSEENTSRKKAKVPTEVKPEVSIDSVKTEVDPTIEPVAKLSSEACEQTKELTDSISPVSVGWSPFDSMESGWKESLTSELERPYFKSLLKFLMSEMKSQTVYPPACDIFSAFNLCPLDKVKVVVIGQDPYHGPDQAHGLAFSVRKGVAVPPSLRNMIAEAKEDPKVKIPSPSHGNLECWSRQGVLMLNTVLTVRKGEANSHQKKGWEDFTDAVVRVLKSRKNVVYLLWGNPAQLKCQGIDARHNTMITTSHPSPLGAYKTSKPFMGSRCFSRCNEALEGYGKEPIDWSIR